MDVTSQLFQNCEGRWGSHRNSDIEQTITMDKLHIPRISITSYLATLPTLDG